jgi:hypothetical protein
MQPIDTAWNILKSRTIRDQSSIHGEYGRPGKFRQPQTMKDIEPPVPGPARSTQTNRMKREMDRQRQDEMMGETRDPFAANEEDDLMGELNPRRDEIAPRPAPPASPAMAKPDPVSPEFIQQLIAEGGSFGLPPSLRQAAEEMRRKEMADKLIGMG